ncbi:glycoside hydrolase family 13 protein [Psychromicrobium sp. YIM B11713]|uniref:glycoside hydrolase family 13 protein n=1 Tax=Psychromicrobium sp. YIM B11713 TaxID=3145233 RepID=UPI00374E8E76
MVKESLSQWWRQAVVYQVYPRSFADQNGDGLGDLPGVTSRIPYLQKLGVDAIWLSPFYPSALADGGYDVDDYRNVDPRLGSLDDFDAMVKAAHQAGLKIIVDIVPNHSSDRHPWFQQALRTQPGSAERARYHFYDGLGANGELPPSDWVSHFGGSAWTRVTAEMAGGQAVPGQWYLHLFAREQPDWNWENPEIHEDFLRTLRFWSDREVDGFRVDVASAMAKDMSLPLRSKPNNDVSVGDGTDPLYDRDEVHTIFESWRTVFDQYDPPRTAVAEAWVPFPERLALYARPTELGQAFNFDLLRADFGANAFRQIIAKCLAEAAATGSSSTWVFSNHDVVRHASRYGLPDSLGIAGEDTWLMSGGTQPALDATRGSRRARAATLLMLALPGSAYLYQGEELGLFEVADLPLNALQDPVWDRTGHQRKGRDGCRVPLPWTKDGASYGFGPESGAQPWLPQPSWFSAFAVTEQEKTAGSSLELYRDALAARRALQTDEELEWLTPSDVESARAASGDSNESAAGSSAAQGTTQNLLHFRRPNGWQSITNFSATALSLPAELIGATVVLASEPGLAPDTRVDESMVLPAETTIWLHQG